MQAASDSTIFENLIELPFFSFCGYEVQACKFRRHISFRQSDVADTYMGIQRLYSQYLYLQYLLHNPIANYPEWPWSTHIRRLTLA